MSEKVGGTQVEKANEFRRRLAEGKPLGDLIFGYSKFTGSADSVDFDLIASVEVDIRKNFVGLINGLDPEKFEISTLLGKAEFEKKFTNEIEGNFSAIIEKCNSEEIGKLFEFDFLKKYFFVETINNSNTISKKLNRDLLRDTLSDVAFRRAFAKEIKENFDNLYKRYLDEALKDPNFQTDPADEISRYCAFEETNQVGDEAAEHRLDDNDKNSEVTTLNEESDALEKPEEFKSDKIMNSSILARAKRNECDMEPMPETEKDSPSLDQGNWH